MWRNLRFVVIDEAHFYRFHFHFLLQRCTNLFGTLRGAFGAHVAMVLRRLVRICLHYSGSFPQFICCSATILNPEEHTRKLVPIDLLSEVIAPKDKTSSSLTVIDSSMDGSPQGER